MWLRWPTKGCCRFPGRWRRGRTHSVAGIASGLQQHSVFRCPDFSATRTKRVRYENSEREQATRTPMRRLQRSSKKVGGSNRTFLTSTVLSCFQVLDLTVACYLTRTNSCSIKIHKSLRIWLLTYDSVRDFIQNSSAIAPRNFLISRGCFWLVVVDGSTDSPRGRHCHSCPEKPSTAGLNRSYRLQLLPAGLLLGNQWFFIHPRLPQYDIRPGKIPQAKACNEPI